jgi:hypothetical protein
MRELHDFDFRIILGICSEVWIYIIIKHTGNRIYGVDSICIMMLFRIYAKRRNA